MLTYSSAIIMVPVVPSASVIGAIQSPSGVVAPNRPKLHGASTQRKTRSITSPAMMIKPNMIRIRMVLFVPDFRAVCRNSHRYLPDL